MNPGKPFAQEGPIAQVPDDASIAKDGGKNPKGSPSSLCPAPTGGSQILRGNGAGLGQFMCEHPWQRAETAGTVTLRIPRKSAPDFPAMPAIDFGTNGPRKNDEAPSVMSPRRAFSGPILLVSPKISGPGDLFAFRSGAYHPAGEFFRNHFTR